MKLITLLKEIGKSNVEDYGYTPENVSRNEDKAVYTFDTDAGNQYAVQIMKWEGEAPDRKSWMFDIAFGIREEEKDKDGNTKIYVDTEVEVNDPKNMYKVMGAVIKAVKEEIAKTEEDEIQKEKKAKEEGKPAKKAEKVKQLTMNPTRRKVKTDTGAEIEDPTDERRKNLYMQYIEKQFPESEVTSGGDYITVDLP